jgi:hypothetical protein
LTLVNIDDQEISADEEGALPEEKFYQGRIIRLSSARQTGVVRSRSGREIPFVFQHVVMLGAKRRFEDLHVGTAVGYDVSWTSRGLRVSVMRVLD